VLCGVVWCGVVWNFREWENWTKYRRKTVSVFGWESSSRLSFPHIASVITMKANYKGETLGLAQ
jgi:hypothetical protein